MKLEKEKIIIISGPTAVGKSKIGIELAKRINGEIISIDSMQIYKDLNIGTAKVSKKEMQNIEHYMIDIKDINTNYNVKEFKEMANYYINHILNKNKIPILVGGTGFYINAILTDVDFNEENDDKKRTIIEKLNNELKNKGETFLHNKLSLIDKESADKIDKNNIKRVIRALTYFELHNEKISKHNQKEQNKEKKYNDIQFFLNDDRKSLYERINARVDKMIQDGLIIEICNLINNGAKKKSNAMSAIAYKELYDYCKNLNEQNSNKTIIQFSNDDMGLIQIIDKIKQHSRNYAKRQITWFKNKTNAIEIRIDKLNYDENKIVDEIIFNLKKN